jgi:RNA polymerase sigma-70 factor (ECF subfamily)
MKGQLFRLAVRLLQNVQEAEDVIQDVMVKIWTRREEWGQWQSMEAYCMTATRNSCLDRMRRQRVVPVGEERARDISSNEKDPYEKMTGKEILSQIRKCMGELPENQQLVVQLREIEGFSYNEIAEVLDMSMEQVKTNLFRARNAIKRSITKEDSPWIKK